MAEIRSKKRKVAIIHESSSSGEEITPSKPSVDELDQSTCQVAYLILNVIMSFFKVDLQKLE